MSWRDLLETTTSVTAPWHGPCLYHGGRTYRVAGPRPPEHGWYRFDLRGRDARVVSREPGEPNDHYLDTYEVVLGYLVGNRLVPDGAAMTVEDFATQTTPLYCYDLSLERFSRAIAARTPGGTVYCGQEFDLGPEQDVRRAYEDRVGIEGVADVSPALEVAFTWSCFQRTRAEERVAQLERDRAAREAKAAAERTAREMMARGGTAVGRRALATHDFDAACREALRVSGATLIGTRPYGHDRIVKYRFRDQRLECVVDHQLNILDAGVCLQDHRTGVKGDRWFTLESLPGVVGEAMDLGVLVVWRHG